jgi:hypothetical protein
LFAGKDYNGLPLLEGQEPGKIWSWWRGNISHWDIGTTIEREAALFLQKDAKTVAEIFYNKRAKMPRRWNEAQEPAMCFFGPFLMQKIAGSDTGGWHSFWWTFPSS